MLYYMPHNVWEGTWTAGAEMRKYIVESTGWTYMKSGLEYIESFTPGQGNAEQPSNSNDVIKGTGVEMINGGNKTATGTDQARAEGGATSAIDAMVIPSYRTTKNPATVSEAGKEAVKVYNNYQDNKAIPESSSNEQDTIFFEETIDSEGRPGSRTIAKPKTNS